MASIPSRSPSGWGKRHTVAALGFWAFAISYAMRFNISIAIVAMAGPLSPEEDAAAPTDHLASQGEFHWDSVEQGIILGSSFVGYVITQLPGGILATKYGGKWTIGIGLLVNAIFAILTPVLARTHVYLLIAARVIQGLGDGVSWPAMNVVMAAWVPPDERSFLGSIVYAGSQFGSAVAMVASGYLIDWGILGGWPSVFYVMGGFSIIWCILWAMLMHDTPASHPTISQEELKYIQDSIGDAHAGAHGTGEPTPWMEIFKSGPMFGILVAHIGHCFGLYMFLTLLPTYLKTVLHFDIKQNSWISALPYLTMWVVAIGTTRIADHLISNKILRTVTVRKLCQVVAHLGSALALIGASYSGCHRDLTVVLLTLAVGVNGAVYGGFLVNYLDIAPNWAGILGGITSTAASLTGCIAPYVGGLLINDDPSIKNWQYLFFIASGIYFLDVLIYVLFASGTEQPWNRLKEHEQTNNRVEAESDRMDTGN